MAFGGKLEAFSNRMSESFKSGSLNVLLVTLKVLSGLVIGLTVSLIGQEIFKYEIIPFFFVIFSVAFAFFRISKSWNFVVTLVFDLICILVALLLRMYIMIAPG